MTVVDGARRVVVDVVDGVCSVRMDHRSTRNALDATMQRELTEAFDAAARDPDVRAIVLTGGEQFFASGADIRELGSMRPVDLLTVERRAVWRALATCPQPLIAAVAGPVLGGGCEMALSCDLIVAAETARFGQPEVKLGITPGAGGIQLWGRAVGRLASGTILLTGRELDAFEACRAGIVEEVVPEGRLLVSAHRLARRLAAGPPRALSAIRQGLAAVEELSRSAAAELDRLNMAALLDTADAHEGVAAFLERRAPRFGST